ncbi:MAG TPA: preprotein translocase subunit SecE [Roseiflexaceae bacterium]|nr:preprotein translocase subunit SecE [Roseiflexaceae bacterium]
MTLAKDKQSDKESQNAARTSDNAIVRSFRESRSELRKVVWPSREETTRLTIVVMLLSAVISALLFASDSLFALLLTLLQSAVAGR